MSAGIRRNAARVRSLNRRGIVSGSNDDGDALKVQVNAGGIARDDIEVVLPYGLSVNPQDGAEVVLSSVGGQTGHQIVIGVGDRRYRVSCARGEVCLHDDQGQKVHMKRDGIEVTPKSGAWVKVNGDDVRLGTGADSALTRWTELGTWIDLLATALGTGTVKVAGVDIPVTWSTGIPAKPAAGTTKVKGK